MALTVCLYLWLPLRVSSADRFVFAFTTCGTFTCQVLAKDLFHCVHLTPSYQSCQRDSVQYCYEQDQHSCLTLERFLWISLRKANRPLHQLMGWCYSCEEEGWIMLWGTPHHHYGAPQAKGGMDRFGYIMELNDPNQCLSLEPNWNWILFKWSWDAAGEEAGLIRHQTFGKAGWMFSYASSHHVTGLWQLKQAVYVLKCGCHRDRLRGWLMVAHMHDCLNHFRHKCWSSRTHLS